MVYLSMKKTTQELASTYDYGSADPDFDWIDLERWRPDGDGWRLLQVVPLRDMKYQLIWSRDVEVEP
jgi:hypothetical protein